MKKYKSSILATAFFLIAGATAIPAPASAATVYVGCRTTSVLAGNTKVMNATGSGSTTSSARYNCVRTSLYWAGWGGPIIIVKWYGTAALPSSGYVDFCTNTAPSCRQYKAGWELWKL